MSGGKECPEEYKQTEAGVISEAWHETALGDAITFQRGFDLPCQSRRTGHVPVVSSAGTTDYHNESIVEAPGVVTGRYGTIGEVFLINEPFWPLNTTLFVRNFHGNDPCYIYYALQQFDFAAFSGKSGVPGVNRNDLHSERISIPRNIDEQRAIAKVLSDVDELLGALDRLIAQKRDIKQAAMQQLLTGQTRLPGFSGEWETRAAREIGVFRGGNGFPLEAQNAKRGDFPFFKVSDMNNEGNETFMTTANHWISEHTRKRLGANVFPANAIVFAKVGAAIFLERKKILGHPSCIDNNMAAFVVDANCADVRFIHTLLLSKKLGLLVATTALPALNGKQLGDMTLILPPLPEQTAIASVLSDMDAELAALEQRRDKTRLLKQGMMQELLTGRIRLPEKRSSHNPAME